MSAQNEGHRNTHDAAQISTSVSSNRHTRASARSFAPWSYHCAVERSPRSCVGIRLMTKARLSNRSQRPRPKTPALSSVYALSKYVQERMCLMIGRAYNIPTVALRFSTCTDHARIRLLITNNLCPQSNWGQYGDAGYSPSIRLFEAAACGCPIISDWR